MKSIREVWQWCKNYNELYKRVSKGKKLRYKTILFMWFVSHPMFYKNPNYRWHFNGMILEILKQKPIEEL